MAFCSVSSSHAGNHQHFCPFTLPEVHLRSVTMSHFSSLLCLWSVSSARREAPRVSPGASFSSPFCRHHDLSPRWPQKALLKGKQMGPDVKSSCGPPRPAPPCPAGLAGTFLAPPSAGAPQKSSHTSASCRGFPCPVPACRPVPGAFKQDGCRSAHTAHTRLSSFGFQSLSAFLGSDHVPS